MSDGIKFDRVKAGTISGTTPAAVRYSTAVRRARANGMSEENLAALEADRKQFGASCPVHGELADPVIGIVEGSMVAFACPHCSGPEVLKAWEDEGKQVN